MVTSAMKHDMSDAARGLRRRATKSEAMLWAALRGKRLGVKFRRQQPIGNFVVNFYASDARLIVEVDGGVHSKQVKADTERQQLLESLGLRVVRVTAHAVEHDLEGVLRLIQQPGNPHPYPSPIKGEGDQRSDSAPPSP